MGEFTKHTTIIVLMRVAVSCIALVASIVIARSLGPERMGVYAILLLIPALALKFANVGVEAATVYQIGRGQYSLGTIIGTNTALGILFGFGSAALIGFGAWILKDSYLIGIPWPFVILAVLAIPSAVFSHFLGGIFLGKKRFDIFSVLRIAADTLFLLLIFLFVVFLKRGVQGVALANAIAAFLIACVTFIAVARLNASMFWNVRMAYVKQLFSYGFQSYAAGLLGFINYKIDVLLVNAFLGTLAVGYYALAVNIGEGLWLITSAAALILFARISSDRDIESINAFTPVVVRNVLFLTICAGIFLLIAGGWIVPALYSKDFLPSLMPLYLLLPGIFAMSVSSILANDYAGRGRPSINIYLAGCGLAIKVASTMILIPIFGIYGAAIATSFSYIIFTSISVLVYRSISKNSLCSVLVLQRSDLVLYKHFVRALLHSARQRLS